MTRAVMVRQASCIASKEVGPGADAVGRTRLLWDELEWACPLGHLTRVGGPHWDTKSERSGDPSGVSKDSNNMSLWVSDGDLSPSTAVLYGPGSKLGAFP